MKKTWLVVAESARAKIYQFSGRVGPFVEVADMVHPESRLHEHELTSDLPGSSASSGGAVMHKMEEPTAPKEQEAIYFSKEIVARLEQGRTRGDYERLVIAASPKFLGLLRKNMNDQLSKMVDGEINKNLLHASEAEIRANLSS